MRRRTARLLADLARAAALLGCAAAGAVAWLWHAAPAAIDAFDRAQREAPVAAAAARLAAAQALPEPAARRAALQALAGELAAAQAGDRLAPIRLACHEALGELAAAAGDLPAAAAAWRARLAVDDRSLAARLRLGELLVAAPTTRREGLAWLAAQAATCRGAPAAAAALARAQLLAGDAAAAAATLAAHAALAPSPAFALAIDDGPWRPVLASVRPDRVELAAELGRAGRRLRLRLPPWFAGALREPQLQLGAPPTEPPLDLLAATGAGSVRRSAAAWHALGGAEQTLAIDLPAAARAPIALRLSAAFTAQLPLELGLLAAAPGLRELAAAGDPLPLADWRRAALAQLQVALPQGAAAPFAATAAGRLRAELALPGGAATAVVFPDLPAGVLLALHGAALVEGDRERPLAPADLLAAPAQGFAAAAAGLLSTAAAPRLAVPAHPAGARLRLEILP